MEDEATRHYYERLLARYLTFYDQLRLRERRPRTAAQRHFQDVAWFKTPPSTEHEKAYVYYLVRTGRAPKAGTLPASSEAIEAYPMGMRPITSEIAAKWAEPFVDSRGSRPDWD